MQKFLYKKQDFQWLGPNTDIHRQKIVDVVALGPKFFLVFIVRLGSTLALNEMITESSQHVKPNRFYRNAKIRHLGQNSAVFIDNCIKYM